MNEKLLKRITPSKLPKSAIHQHRVDLPQLFIYGFKTLAKIARSQPLVRKSVPNARLKPSAFLRKSVKFCQNPKFACNRKKQTLSYSQQKLSSQIANKLPFCRLLFSKGTFSIILSNQKKVCQYKAVPFFHTP